MRAARLFWPLALCAWIGLVALALYPVQNTALRTALLVCAGISAFAVLALIRSNRLRAVFILVLVAVLLIVVLGPMRPVDTARLRQNYVETLRSYEGTRYIWGGENRLGVDCSGLLRAAWVETQLKQGMRELNPGQIREACLTWWQDETANTMGTTNALHTRRLFEAPSVRAIDHRVLQPGDMAVVAKGVHIMAHLGDLQWIEADPGQKRVVILNLKDRNPWFDSATVIVRWTELTGSAR